MARAERIIVSANIPTLNMNQLSILAHVDMMTNRVLMEEVYKEFDKIFLMSYSEAIAEIRKIHTQLMTSKTRKYDGHGEGRGGINNPKVENKKINNIDNERDNQVF